MLESGRDIILAVSIVATVLFGFFVLLIILVVVSVQKKKLRLEMLRREDEVRHQLEVSRKAGEVREQTLHYVARELHDGVSQLLGVAMLYLNHGTERNDLPQAERVRGVLQQALNETRAISKGLQAGLVSEGHIQEAMRQQLEQLQNAGSFRTELECTLKNWSWDFDRQLLLYRIFQEMLQNAIKHSKATRLHVSLIGSGDYTQLVFQDNGIGFDTAAAQGGMGMDNLKERAAILDCRLQIESTAGKGTRIVLVSDF